MEHTERKQYITFFTAFAALVASVVLALSSTAIAQTTTDSTTGTNDGTSLPDNETEIDDDLNDEDATNDTDMTDDTERDMNDTTNGEITNVISLAQSMPAPMVVDVRSDGSALVRGMVTGVDTNAITLTSWGGTWTIRTDASQIISGPPDGSSVISAISPGDFVGAAGTMATDQTLALNATLVRNWTTSPFTGDTGDTATSSPSGTPGGATEGGTGGTVEGIGIPDTATSTGTPEDTEATEIPDSAGAAEDRDAAQTWTGSVDTITDASFTFTDSSGTSYTVEMGPGAQLVNEQGEIITFNDMDEGDDVTIEGTLQRGSTIEAQMIEVDTSFFLF